MLPLSLATTTNDDEATLLAHLDGDGDGEEIGRRGAGAGAGAA
jgi:hypothetical protein